MHQCGFNEKHGTIEQVESREYCSAVFLDVSKPFDRVWLDGLIYKTRKYAIVEYLDYQIPLLS